MASSGAWARIETRVRTEQNDPAGTAARQELALAGLQSEGVRVHTVYYLDGIRNPDRVAREILTDPVTEESGMSPLPGIGVAVSVCKRPGVMDPVESAVRRALRTQDEQPERVVTGRTYWIETEADSASVLEAVRRSLANEVIEDIALGPVPEPRPLPRGSVTAAPTVPLEGLSEEELLAVSRRHTLALTAEEMTTIRNHFQSLGRAPRLGELETLAQTWSEHCKHKTLTGPIDYVENGERQQIENLLKETVFGATQELDRDWCVSVFKDNAGIVRFDPENDICFKVETHNHPSAIEPYGGAGTGIGGVIRDILGTGLAARPVANTDVFCFGELDTEDVPKGTLHPLRVMRGVVAGVRDYGNRMGIPTVNGAVCFDPRYVGNPIVYCGTVGILPKGMAEKSAQPGDRIVVAGGKTGRDGIHGATFSSEALHDESDTVSSGAVQIGNPIEEKRVLDTLLQARDRGLYTCVTDCGAGGFSSAVGEMAEGLGALVHLERAPLKYVGLSPVEIWISEAQERMVLAVPAEHEEECLSLFRSEDVEAVTIGEFNDSGRLVVLHEGETVVDLDLEFLHDGLPRTPRPAVWADPGQTPLPTELPDLGAALLDVLADGNVCSKEWIIRQYDHEVQAGSALKPLVGATERGPGDAAVVAPLLGKRVGAVIANGILPRLGDVDPYHMAMCTVDEAMRNAVAVGADPDRIALLDNFSWGDCSRPETLGAMVRAARGCRDAALLFGAPFISGKDSLNNEFESGQGRISIPHTLLISALGRIEDVTDAVSSDLKRPGSRLVLVGTTRPETGGGTAWRRAPGGSVPRVRPDAPEILRAVHKALRTRDVLACHDLSEGGLAVAAAEMALGGGLGFRVDPRKAPGAAEIDRLDVLLFSESPTRFLLEVDGEIQLDVPHADIGEVLEETRLDYGPGLSLDLSEARNAFHVWEKVL